MKDKKPHDPNSAHDVAGILGKMWRTIGEIRALRLSAALFAVTFWLTAVWLARTRSGLVANITDKSSEADKLSMTDCLQCHQTLAAVWRASAHATSATSDCFRARVETAGSAPDCLPCHAPQPILRTGVANPILVRSGGHEDGISCLSCHERADGVAGGRTREEVGCRPRASLELSSDALCGGCHRSVYDDVRRVRETSDQPNCIECHMYRNFAANEDAPGHSFRTGPVGHSITMTVRRERGVLVEISNSNPAHAFPAERHNRILMLKVEYFAGDTVVNEEFHTIRAVIPFNTPRRSDEIAAGKSYSLRLDNHGGAVRVSLLYKRVPWILHSQAAILRQVTLNTKDTEGRSP